MIELINIHKSFGENKVLSGIHLTVNKNETTVILGKSGTGKSVLIKHIVRLLEPDLGMVLVDGEDINAMNDQQLQTFRKRTGFLFQSAALYDSFSVFENIAFPLRRHTNHSESEIEHLVMEALQWIGLPNTAYKMPSELSGGMRKRVGLARTFILKPEIMLYDEPTTGLDPITSSEISTLILRLQKEYGITSIVVTHDMPCAFTVADRALLLHDGNFLFDGKITDIATAKTDFVSEFFNASQSKTSSI